MAEAPDLATLRRLTDGGYTFYNDTKRRRADDLYVRGQAADALNRAAASLAGAERAARAALAPPSRAKPFPDAAELAGIRALQAAQARIAGLETRLRGAAALPDRDFSRIVPSDAARQELVALDAALLTSTAALEAHSADDMSLAAVETAIRARETFAARGKKE
jgi:hypothetical protein